MKNNTAIFLFITVLFTIRVAAQTGQSLPRSTPEAEGVSSAAIAIFLDSVANSRHEFHSFMLVRHGKVIAEGWWKPYRPDLKHTLYSLSKSFTATAVGFAQAEGKLSVKDKVISFFPEAKPDSVSPFLQHLSVKDLLTMSVGQEPDPTGVVIKDTNWVKTFLALPIKHKPGSKFLYNSMATYMLSAIVQKQTGQTILAYLQPRLFEPLGIQGADWETDPKGISTGGWGLRLKTEDIAKFAQLFLQNGRWNGKQVLPAGWVEEASHAHIIQHPEYTQAKKDSSDWEQGYGYQMWRSRNKAYRGDGAFGQYALILPEQDAIIAITSETPNMQGELDLIWQLLMPAMKKEKLPADDRAVASLKSKLSSLSLPAKKDKISPSFKTARRYVMDTNPEQIRELTFQFGDDKGLLTVQTATGQHNLQFARNDWQLSETSLRGPYLVAGAKNALAGLAPFKVAGEYTWIDEHTLELVLRYIESPHTQTIICRFEDDTIAVEMNRSFSFNAHGTAIRLNGTLQQPVGSK